MLIVLNCGRDIIAYFVFWNPMISKSFGTLIPCSIAAFMNMTATESRTANLFASEVFSHRAKNSLNASNEFSNLLYSP